MSNVYGSDKPSPLVRPNEGEQNDSALDEMTLVFIAGRLLDANLSKILRQYERTVVMWFEDSWRAQRALITEEVAAELLNGVIADSARSGIYNMITSLIDDSLVPYWYQIGQAGIASTMPELLRLIPTLETPLAANRLRELFSLRRNELITDFTEMQLKAMRNLVRTIQVSGPAISARDLAKLIRPTIGLTSRQSTAVARLRKQLIEQGSTQSVIDAQIQRYTNTLRRLRSHRIAITESSLAFNFGSLETITHAIEKGAFPNGVVKEFLTAKDEAVCSWCRPLNGTRVFLDETFPSNFKTTPNMLVPPLHPRCRCTILYKEIRND